MVYVYGFLLIPVAYISIMSIIIFINQLIGYNADILLYFNSVDTTYYTGYRIIKFNMIKLCR